MNIRKNVVKFILLLVIAVLLIAPAQAGLAQTVQEWSEPVNLSMSGAASKPSMVVDSTGVIHVIWLDAFEGYKYVQSVDQGLTWTTPVAVKFPFSTQAEPPVLFSDPRGVIHIFWMREQNKLSYAQTLNENLDTPPAWRRRVDMDISVYDFDASVDEQGGLHVAYMKNPAPTPGTAGIFYRQSTDGGANWSGIKLLYESPYFRNLTAENAHIRLAVADHSEAKAVYVVWDDRVQKRIFTVNSLDGGLNWGPIKEMIAPQENLSFRSPFGADIDVLGDKILVTWFVGEEGRRCAVYSWASADNGETWGEQVPVLSESAQCPEQSEFISIEPGYSVSLFTIQGDLSLSAWNGSEWSTPELQTGPSSITNPTTFDLVLLGCKSTASYDGHLFVVGCDEGPGADIWFLSRPLDSLETLFPLPSEWSGDASLLTVPRKIEALASIGDRAGNVHTVWIQAPSSPADSFAPRIEYARWNGTEWSRPAPIITNLGGVPRNVALQVDSQQRLLLSWASPQTGELLFAWANSERANIPLEWAQPVVLSNASSLISSPDMFVDASDRIVVAYAVSLNEGRGIYLTQSGDLGKTWSIPVKVFDAVAENWEMVDQPKLAVSEDGTLHILFTRYELFDGPQPIGLYYSQSSDGGSTWTLPEILSEGPVQWSEVIAYRNTVHRLWQEQNKLVASTNHQISEDGGTTWSPTDKLPGEAGLNSQPAAMIAADGSLHFLQVSDQDTQILQEWGWMNGVWQLVESRKVASLELSRPPALAGGITTQGTIYSVLLLENQLDSETETTIRSYYRSLDIEDGGQLALPAISTPSVVATPTANASQQPTPTLRSPLADLSDPEPRINRNIVGFLLITIVVVLILVFTLPRKSRTPDGNNPSK